MGFFDSGSDEEYQKLTMSSYPFSPCYIIDGHLSVIGYPLAHLKNPKEGLLRRCEVAALVSAENTWGVGGGLRNEAGYKHKSEDFSSHVSWEYTQLWFCGLTCRFRRNSGRAFP